MIIFPAGARRAALALTATAALVAGLGTAALGTAAPAAATTSPTTRAQALADAARVATKAKYHVGIAVIDRTTGATYTAGDARGSFATESVVKVMIATRILLQGRMHGSVEKTAYKMITQSDDASATSLYGGVGGDGLITWIKKHYDLPHLGSAPTHHGWWGNTKITPLGMAQLYVKLAADKKVSSWLLNAMHHAHRYGSDGTFQFFGLGSATTGAALKMGWGCDLTSGCAEADFNSTGYVNGNRYAVAILARGPLHTYGKAISNALTAIAKALLPGGTFPPGTPSVSSLSAHLSKTNGGATLTIHGRDFSHVTGVYFGSYPSSKVKTVSATTIQALVPHHGAAKTYVRVHTAYGTSAGTTKTYMTFVAAPSIQTVSAQYLATAGGTRITLTGHDFDLLQSVTLDGSKATGITRTSATRMSFTAPAHAAGTVGLRVTGAYGTSAAKPVVYDDAPGIATTALPTATQTEPYQATLQTADRRSGTWTTTALPAGLTLQGATIQGTPTTSGPTTVTVTFTDAFGRTASRPLILTVAGPDGPAGP